MPTVYLIHFDKPYKHARHYLGYTALESANARLQRHKSGDGAKLLRVCNENNIDYDIVRMWDCNNIHDAKVLEHKLKKQHNSAKLCPICRKERKDE